MAERQRALALKKYWEAPNVCKHCSTAIGVRDNEKVSQARHRIFCDSSCAASWNNTGKAKNILGVNGRFRKEPRNGVCQTCTKPFTRTSNKVPKFCSKVLLQGLL
jgi:hypothetical protein